MARPLRLEFPGALYHITSRGDRREDVFDDAQDFQRFLEIFSEGCRTYNWVCYAYCLMNNHYHLLVETPDSNLSIGMRHLNGVYTQSFNRRHQRVGHVFQGRYKAILVDKDSYLMELSRYIVLNPVRAEMVRSAKDWPWSSYRSMVGQQPCPEWLNVKWLLSCFGNNMELALNSFKRFVSEGKNQPSPWGQLRNQVYLGDDQFVERMQSLLDKEEDLSEIPSAQRRGIPKSLEEYAAIEANRDQAIYSAYASGGYTMKEIGSYFGLHYSRVSRILKMAKGKT